MISKSPIDKTVFTVAAILCLWVFVLPAFAVGDTWDLGGTQLKTTENDSPPLEIESEGSESLISLKFVGSVGGVNFEGVAQPVEVLRDVSISLYYDRTQMDGKRLTIRLGSNNYQASIHDWQLKPISLFADTEFTAIVSLFGEGPDGDNNYYIQYHAAFKDTLLGLRLLQADIILMSPHSHRGLPTLNGRTVIGSGELTANDSQFESAAVEISELMQEHSFQSWVLTDIGARPNFAVRNGNFIVGNDPYFHFWRHNDAAIARHSALIDEYNGKLAPINQLILSREALAANHGAKVEAYNAEALHNAALHAQISALGLEVDEADQKIAIENRQLEVLEKQIDEGPAVDSVDALTAGIKLRSGRLQALSPAVFDAYQNTASFSSFFRYVKLQYPKAWKQYVEQIRSVSIRPVIETPTEMPRS